MKLFLWLKVYEFMNCMGQKFYTCQHIVAISTHLNLFGAKPRYTSAAELGKMGLERKVCKRCKGEYWSRSVCLFFSVD
jgi:hypothetical protein